MLCGIGCFGRNPIKNAVQLTQGATVDWYFLDANPEATVSNGSVTMNGKTYDLSQGDVETVFAYKAPTPTGINNVQESESAEKFIRNGQLYIRQSGCVYDAQGRLVFDF